jgi:hypothetical protein
MPYGPERRTVEAFERAVREHAWLGAQPPEAHREIEQHYHRKKAKLLELLGFEYTIPVEPDEDD